MADYASLEQLKLWMNISQDTYDTILEMVITGVSTVIDQIVDNPIPEEVPNNITLACLILAAHVYKRKESPYGVIGSPDFVTELMVKAKDPTVQFLLRPSRNIWGAVGGTDES